LKGLHERFWEEPNIYFAQYDVLNHRYRRAHHRQSPFFHAFFFVGGLTFEEELLHALFLVGVLTFEEQEERQLIARLRPRRLKHLTDRQSYLLFRKAKDPQAFVVV
jgi:hypothetical protein